MLKTYLLKGYAIDGQRVLVSDENYIALINREKTLDGRVSKLEKDLKDRVIFDALSLLSDIVSKATSSIVLMV